MEKYFKDKVICLTGGTGSLGQELTKRILAFSPKEIIIFSRNEKVQHEMRIKWPGLSFVLGDVSDMEAVRRVVKGVDIVIHAAAVKHIPVAEKQPRMTIMTNIIGSMNVVQACEDAKVEQCLCISTDKAAAPLNVYGMSKFLMERIFIEAAEKSEKTKFKVVRYGNVENSSGSFIPLWLRQKEMGERIRVTDPDMTRFFFTVQDAVQLIIDVLIDGDVGKIYSLPMKAARIGDIAEIVSNNDYDVIGNRGGEKVHEDLFSKAEARKLSLVSCNGRQLLCYDMKVLDNDNQYKVNSGEVERYTRDDILRMISK